jgi:hypothetical protein
MEATYLLLLLILWGLFCAIIAYECTLLDSYRPSVRNFILCGGATAACAISVCLSFVWDWLGPAKPLCILTAITTREEEILPPLGCLPTRVFFGFLVMAVGILFATALAVLVTGPIVFILDEYKYYCQQEKDVVQKQTVERQTIDSKRN